jgi:hypothetical protein
MNHLRKTQKSYCEHFQHAIVCAKDIFLCSAALFIHAIYPDWFEFYASENLPLISNRMYMQNEKKMGIK